MALAHGRSTPGSENGRFWGRRGHSEAIFALAVPAWHRTVHCTVFYRNYGKVRCDNYGSTFNKYGAYRTDRNRTVPYNSTSLVIMRVCSSLRYAPHQHTHDKPPPPQLACTTYTQIPTQIHKDLLVGVDSHHAPCTSHIKNTQRHRHLLVGIDSHHALLQLL